MSTRELVHTMIDQLSDEQLQALAVILGYTTQKETESQPTPSSVRGIFSNCADAECVPLEKEAWERAVVKKHEDS